MWTVATNMQPDQAQLDELVRRIVEAVHPLRIILFGSAARGEMGEDSDVDVLVVVPEGTAQRPTAQYLYTQFRGLPLAVEVLVTTPSRLERYRESLGLVYRSILREGRELYAV